MICFGVYLRLDSADLGEVAVCALAHVLIGRIFGTWALVQVIVAIATLRDTGFEIVAIVAAFLAPGLSSLLYMGIALAGVDG